MKSVLIIKWALIGALTGALMDVFCKYMGIEGQDCWIVVTCTASLAVLIID